MTNAKKTAKTAAKAVSPKLEAMIAGTAAIAYGVAGGFEDAVTHVRSAAKLLPKGANVLTHPAMARLFSEYRAGHVARRLMGEASFAKRWGNYGPEQAVAAAKEVIAKDPKNRGTVGHLACRAADTSLVLVRRRAGLQATKAGNTGPRKPRTSTVPSGNVPPVDLVKTSPKLASKAAVNDYYATACAALLATVDKNAKHTLPQISSAVTDFAAALRAAGVMPPAAS